MEDAVLNWPIEYPDIIDEVVPDAVYKTHWPLIGDPNDHQFSDSRNVNEDYTQSGCEGHNHDINIESAWRELHFGSSASVIAIVDTGVQYKYGTDIFDDLRQNTTATGFNTGDRLSSSQFKARNDGGGEPWQWILNMGSKTAKWCGHGTWVAGISSALIDNDGDGMTLATCIGAAPDFWMHMPHFTTFHRRCK